MSFKMKENRLFIDGVDSVELVKEYGSPLYVMSHQKLSENFEELANSFQNKYENVKVHYASKSFLNIAICQYVKKYNFGIDVVSMGELFVAKTAGISTSDMEFHGNSKSLEEIEYAVREDIGLIVVDNLNELEFIEQECARQNKVQNIIFRITPDVKGGAHAKISTGQKDSKFGIPIINGVIYDVIEKAMSFEHINFKGIHFHIGSQLLTNTQHLEAIDVSMNIIKTIKEKFNYEIEVFNIGGGFGINYLPNTNAPKLNYYFEPIMDKIETEFKKLNFNKRPKIIIEPGRFPVGEAGITLYSVCSIKEIPGIRTYVGVDGGMTDNIRPSMYDANYFAMIANKIEEKNTNTYTIAGKCCESGDIVIKDIELPCVENGDIIAVFATGAYGYSMASNYNKNLIPPVLLVKDGSVQTMTKRQTLESLVDRDCMVNID